MAELGLPVQTGPGRLGCAARSRRWAWPSHVEAGDGDGAEPQVPVAPAASRRLPPGLGPEDQLAACRCASRARHRHRRSQESWAAPVGTGTGSSGLPANRGSTGSTSARRAKPRLRAHALRRSAAITTSSHFRPSSSGPAAAARCRRATACWAARQLLAPGAQLAAGDSKLQRRRHRDEGTASLAHHRPQANHSRSRAGPAAPPRSAPGPGGTPEALPAAVLRPRRPAAPRWSGSHGRSPCSGQARPAPATAPAKRWWAACLRSVSHLRGSSCDRNACSPCWVMACSPPVQVSEPSAASASPAMRSSSARSRPSAATTMVSGPRWIRTVSGTSRSIHNPDIPVEPPARLVAEAHRVGFAPQEETCLAAMRVEVHGREEQR
jgi:hypothetical protein